MELPDIRAVQDPDECRHKFAGIVATLLTYMNGNVAGPNVSVKIGALRSLYRKTRDTIVTDEQVTRRIGACLFRWRAKIRARDDEFFHTVPLTDILGDIESNGGVELPDVIKSKEGDIIREEFYTGTTPPIRAAIMDAFNLMLTLYARTILPTSQKQ